MFFYGQKCAICEQPITQGQAMFGTWGRWLPGIDPLYRFCDGSMHWDCYAKWPQRQRFAASYFQFWVENEENDAFWHRAYLDGGVLVTVNPIEPVESAWIHLKVTGTRHDVKLKKWETWLAAEPEADSHPILAEAIRQAKRVLRDERPTRERLLAGIDESRKAPVVERYRAAQKTQRDAQREVQRQVNPHNEACNRLMKRIERDGLTCPHCRTHSKEYRLSKRQRYKSAIICKQCSWVVDPILEYE